MANIRAGLLAVPADQIEVVGGALELAGFNDGTDAFGVGNPGQGEIFILLLHRNAYPLMVAKNSSAMGRYRTITTEKDRENVSGDGDATDHRRQQSLTRVRSRIQDELREDFEILAEHQPALLAKLRDVVCED